MITFLLYFIIAILSTLIFLHKYKLKTWNEHGIPYDNPYFFATSLKGVGKTKHISEVYKSIYNAFKEKVSIVGFYKFSGPSLMLLDLEIIKQILIKDFSSFSHRGFYVNEKDDPLTANLIHVDGQRWKDLRQKLTSTFTSGKMKFMFPTFVEVSERFSNTLLEMIHEESTVKISELLGRFTMDIIGSCAFGIECNSLKDPEATFLRMGKGGLKNRNCFTVQVLMLLFPKLAAFFGMKIVPDQVSDFFLKIVQENCRLTGKSPEILYKISVVR
uniref:Cytochrome P450 n=1 Tax=Megaselia scalaris TaxID=36166 RepID=T1GHM5_MEGSC